MLAKVQATVHLSQSDTPHGLKAAIEGRIQALANVHALFVQSRWTGADLRKLVTQELSPYSQNEKTRTRIDGPTLLLEPDAALDGSCSAGQRQVAHWSGCRCARLRLARNGDDDTRPKWPGAACMACRRTCVRNRPSDLKPGEGSAFGRLLLMERLDFAMSSTDPRSAGCAASPGAGIVSPH